MKISIALITFNGEKFLQDQLSSYVNQTHLPDELIVCDDSSSDNTIKILENFSKIAPFNVFIHKNDLNLGCSVNVGKALSLCKGDIIFLSDQDDVWFPEKIEVVTNQFKKNQEILLVINDAEITDKKLTPSGVTQANQILKTGLSTDQVINGCFSAISKKLLPYILPLDLKFIAYDSFINELAIILDSRLYIDKVLQYYRRHDSNLSSHFTSKPFILSKRNSYLKLLASNTIEKLKEHLFTLEQIKFRINKENSTINNNVFKIKNELGLIKISRKEKIINERLEILSKSRLFRLPFILKFGLKGNYKHFSGFKSFLKDLCM